MSDYKDAITRLGRVDKGATPKRVIYAIDEAVGVMLDMSRRHQADAREIMGLRIQLGEEWQRNVDLRKDIAELKQENERLGNSGKGWARGYENIRS